jgi:threonine synthase
MKYYSTRDTAVDLGAAQAVQQGLSRDGGLLTPTEFPTLSRKELEALLPMSYPRRAAAVMGLYLTDYSAEELLDFAETAYGPPGLTPPPWPRCGRWTKLPTAWNCGTGLPPHLKIWRFRCCPGCCPPL